MAVVQLTAKGKRQSILFLDGEPAGPVQNSDMLFLSVHDGDSVSDEKMTEILRDYVLPSGRKKALDLLLAEDRTEFELKNRLLQSGYGESVTASIMDYVKQYPYLNDVRYALNYLHSFGNKKSMLEIRHKLSAKGISSEDFEEAYSEYCGERADCLDNDGSRLNEEEIELDAVRNLLRKKVTPGTPLSRQQKEKLYASLLRKGFGYHTVRIALKEYPNEEE